MLVDPRQQSVQSEAGPLGCVVSPPERAKGHSGPPLGRVREGREASVKLTCPGEELFAPLERKQPPPPTRSDLQSSRMGESNQSRSARSLARLIDRFGPFAQSKFLLKTEIDELVRGNFSEGFSKSTCRNAYGVTCPKKKRDSAGGRRLRDTAFCCQSIVSGATMLLVPTTLKSRKP